MEQYIILNCAASADGKIALPNKERLELSNEIDLKRVHSLRSECDAIIVGIDTVIEDNPSLTINKKYASGENPTRIILDTKYRTPENSNIIKNDSKTIIVIGEKTLDKKLPYTVTIKCGKEKIDLEKLLDTLKKRNIRKILVEGGETVLWSFIEKQLFDEFNIFISNLIVGGENTPTIAGGRGFLTKKDILKLELKDVTRMGNGILIKYAKNNNKKAH